VITQAHRTAYQQSADTAQASTRCLHAALACLSPMPRTLLDVGCGPGHLVYLADTLGMKSIGLDCCLESRAISGKSSLLNVDLTQPVDLGEQFDWVLCWEVAEHLPESAVSVLCATLLNHLGLGGKLLFTAAVPGQGGSGHVNEQPQDYWRRSLNGEARYDEGLSRLLSHFWVQVAPEAWWYGQNVQVFTR